MQCADQNAKHQVEMTAVNGVSYPAPISIPVSYTSGIPLMQCADQNAKHQVEMTAVNDVSHPTVISIPVCYTSGIPIRCSVMNKTPNIT
jgi:hypothetical protein